MGFSFPSSRVALKGAVLSWTLLLLLFPFPGRGWSRLGGDVASRPSCLPQETAPRKVAIKHLLHAAGKADSLLLLRLWVAFSNASK